MGSPRSPAAGAPASTAEADPRPDSVEARPLAEVGAVGYLPRKRRPIAGRLWVIGVIVAGVGAAAIALAPAIVTAALEPTGQPDQRRRGRGTGREPAADADPDDRNFGQPGGQPPPVAVARPPKYGPVSYEAEDASNILTGAASVSSYPGASGGKVVANLGRWGPGGEA